MPMKTGEQLLEEEQAMRDARRGVRRAGDEVPAGEGAGLAGEAEGQGGEAADVGRGDQRRGREPMRGERRRGAVAGQARRGWRSPGRGAKGRGPPLANRTAAAASATRGQARRPAGQAGQ